VLSNYDIRFHKQFYKRAYFYFFGRPVAFWTAIKIEELGKCALVADTLEMFLGTEPQDVFGTVRPPAPQRYRMAENYLVRNHVNAWNVLFADGSVKTYVDGSQAVTHAVVDRWSVNVPSGCAPAQKAQTPLNPNKSAQLPAFRGRRATCEGQAEMWFGHGRGVSNFLYVDIGNGACMALVIDGSIYQGEGFASEWGHTTIDRDGPLASLRDYFKCDLDTLDKLRTELRTRGIFTRPALRDMWYICTAHTEAGIDRTLEVAAKVVPLIERKG